MGQAAYEPKPPTSPRRRKPCDMEVFEEPSFGARTGDPLLAMRFACTCTGLSARCNLPLRDPKPPRRSSNLYPEPSPNARRRRWESTSSPRAGSGVRRLVWLVPHRAARLPLHADGFGEAGDTRGGECAQELVEWPRRDLAADSGRLASAVPVRSRPWLVVVSRRCSLVSRRCSLSSRARAYTRSRWRAQENPPPYAVSSHWKGSVDALGSKSTGHQLFVTEA